MKNFQATIIWIDSKIWFKVIVIKDEKIYTKQFTKLFGATSYVEQIWREK